MMNLYEKLNRLDDSLVESKRVVKKKKLTESVEDDKKKLFDAAASVKCKLDEDTIEYAMYDVDDFIENELVYCGKLLLSECPDMLFWRYVSDENFGGYCAVYESDEEFADAFYQISHDRVYDITDEVNGDYDFDDDIDETLTEGIWAYQTYVEKQPDEKQPSKSLTYGNHFIMSRSPYRKERFGDDWKNHINKIIEWCQENNPSLIRETHDFRLDNFGKNLNTPEAFIAAIEQGISTDKYELILTEAASEGTDAMKNNKVKLEVKFETYGRYGDGGDIRKGRVSGETEVEALMKMLDHVHMYTDSDYAEEFKERTGRYPTTEEVLDNLYDQNGDGCDLIYYIRNLTTGEMIFDGGVEESDPEEWD